VHPRAERWTRGGVDATEETRGQLVQTVERRDTRVESVDDTTFQKSLPAFPRDPDSILKKAAVIERRDHAATIARQ